MTRQQFIDDITTWDELIEWCCEHGCYYCEDIYSAQARDDDIDEELVDLIRNNRWYELRDKLDDLETGYDYWRKDDYGDWIGVDDDFDDYFNDILDWADTHGEFDDEEEEFIPEDIAESPFDEEPDEFNVDTDVSLDAFFASSAEDFGKITAETKAAEVKSNTDFNKFIQQVTTVGDY